MATDVLALQNQRLREAPLWTLLASDNGPAVLAILEAQLLEEDRTVAYSVLLERMREDLRRLRLVGFEINQAPDRLLAQWLAAGYLIRRLPPGAAEEEFELSVEAVNAIRFLKGLRAPRATATESRLSLVISQLIDLDQETQESPQSKLDALLAERSRIDAEIAEVQAGRWQALPQERALERVREILSLADDLIADFRRVRDEFERLHRRLREQIVDSEGGRGDVLEELFRGVDVISASDPGKSFTAFYSLLIDQEQSAALKSAISQMMNRQFVQKLDARERKLLRGLTRTLLQQSMGVHEVMQGFARSLREFVRSTEYRELKRLNQLIKEAERTALQVKEILKPQDRVGLELDLTSAIVGSSSELKLYDHALAYEGGDMVADPGEVSLDDMADLFAHGEIDFATLRQDIAAMLGKFPQASIGQVLEHYPARQGLGSVVGLLWLAEQQGIVSSGSEAVEWRGLDGRHRRADIPVAYFVRQDDDGR